MSAVIGVVSFPGSNGDRDALAAFRDDVGVPTRMIDYRERGLDGIGAVVLPGGFSYGDHLRCGAIARFAPVMTAIAQFAAAGGPVLGICNGFQVLTEAGLLPGVLRRNQSRRFHCGWVQVRVEAANTAWTAECAGGTVLRLPVAHGAGAYYAAAETLAKLEAEGQVVFRYSDATGNISPKFNPNGSINNIAGITNPHGNVVGLMPHPERSADRLVGGDDGLKVLRAALAMVAVAV